MAITQVPAPDLQQFLDDRKDRLLAKLASEIEKDHQEILALMGKPERGRAGGKKKPHELTQAELLARFEAWVHSHQTGVTLPDEAYRREHLY